VGLCDAGAVWDLAGVAVWLTGVLARPQDHRSAAEPLARTLNGCSGRGRDYVTRDLAGVDVRLPGDLALGRDRRGGAERPHRTLNG
jgi:hypothetical protein